MIRWIAFDADDTLWENEAYYQQTQARLEAILADTYSAKEVQTALLATETRNIPLYGYGIKSFGLSMIETAIQLSDGNLSGHEIAEILAALRKMMETKVAVLPGVEETLQVLQGKYRLLVITKGDLLDQERKLENSNLAGYFESMEVVSEKGIHTYQRIMKRYDILPEQLLMVGNSLRSDVLPAAAAGIHAVLIDQDFTWEHEKIIDPDLADHKYYCIDQIDHLPDLLEKIATGEVRPDCNGR